MMRIREDLSNVRWEMVPSLCSLKITAGLRGNPWQHLGGNQRFVISL